MLHGLCQKYCKILTGLNWLVIGPKDERLYSNRGNLSFQSINILDQMFKQQGLKGDPVSCAQLRVLFPRVPLRSHSIWHLLTSQLIFFPIIIAKACYSHDVRWRAAQDAASSREGQRSAVPCVQQYGIRGTVQQSGKEQRILRKQVPRWQKDLHGKTWFTLQRQPRCSQQVVEHSPPSLKTIDHRSDRVQAPSFFWAAKRVVAYTVIQKDTLQLPRS
jgi:hypothetical protein